MSSNDDMLVRKVEQQVKNENFPSASGCLLSSLDLISPIGKIKQREPGPITSTPRVFAAERRDHIFQSNCFDKLSHIHEACLF
uniref:Bm9250 n=1 Tax=Brugia malayi TaxID=6279 RepID=A0A1I9G112_BRUMA|nr:Bm9250 [Brugia malayi]